MNNEKEHGSQASSLHTAPPRSPKVALRGTRSLHGSPPDIFCKQILIMLGVSGYPAPANHGKSSRSAASRSCAASKLLPYCPVSAKGLNFRSKSSRFCGIVQAEQGGGGQVFRRIASKSPAKRTDYLQNVPKKQRRRKKENNMCVTDHSKDPPFSGQRKYFGRLQQGTEAAEVFKNQPKHLLPPFLTFPDFTACF